MSTIHTFHKEQNRRMIEQTRLFDGIFREGLLNVFAPIPQGLY